MGDVHIGLSYVYVRNRIVQVDAVNLQRYVRRGLSGEGRGEEGRRVYSSGTRRGWREREGEEGDEEVKREKKSDIWNHMVVGIEKNIEYECRRIENRGENFNDHNKIFFLKNEFRV